MIRQSLAGGLAAILLLAACSLGAVRAASGQESGGEARATVDELKQMLAAGDARVLVLDVRGGEIERKVKGALHIPLGDLEARLDELPRGREIITYCA